MRGFQGSQILNDIITAMRWYWSDKTSEFAFELVNSERLLTPLLFVCWPISGQIQPCTQETAYGDYMLLLIVLIKY